MEVDNVLIKTKKQTLDNKKIIISILVIILILALIISITLGRYSIKLSELWNVVAHYLFGTDANYEEAVETVLFKVRLPRIIASIIIGLALAVSGSTYQGLFKNPMVSPDLLGASSGAGFGAAIALLLSASVFTVQISSFAFGIIAVVLTYAISSIISRKTNSTLTLVLTGMVISTLFSSFISIIKYVADPDSKLPEITFWLMGGLSSITNSDILFLILPIILGVIPIILLKYKLNVISFGEEEAKAMGINTNRLRLIFIVCSTLITSASVAASGMIGWVGLIIPHLARMLVGPNYKVLLPTSMLLGAIYLLIIDDLARCLFSIEIPLGILTSIIGAPFFIYLLLKGKKGWA